MYTKWHVIFHNHYTLYSKIRNSRKSLIKKKKKKISRRVCLRKRQLKTQEEFNRFETRLSRVSFIYLFFLMGSFIDYTIINHATFFYNSLPPKKKKKNTHTHSHTHTQHNTTQHNSFNLSFSKLLPFSMSLYISQSSLSCCYYHSRALPSLSLLCCKYFVHFLFSL